MSTSTYASLSRMSDTVKPRFLFPNGITDLTVDLPGQSAPDRVDRNRSRANSTPREAGTTEQPTNRSRWRTKEFYVYYLAFIVVVPQMAYAVIKLSRGACEAAQKSQGSLRRLPS